MKKLMILAMVATFAFGSTACKKDRTCTCDGDSMGEITIPLNGYKKGDAKDACDAAETTYKNADETATCSLD